MPPTHDNHGPRSSGDRGEDPFDKYVSPNKQQAAAEGKPYNVDIELTRRCPATCRFCTSNSGDTDVMIPTERMFPLLGELWEVGYQQIFWSGGEPLLHPAVFELIEHARSLGFGNGVFSGGQVLTKKMARKVVEFYRRRLINVFGIHIDTLNQDAFNKMHTNPRELARRIEGYRNLLEAGYPPERVLPCVTLTGAAAEHIEELIDWYVDEMGARFLEITVFKPNGAGSRSKDLEPSLSDVRRAFLYRAQKLENENWARIGSTECSTIQCRTNLCLTSDGCVMPCGQLPHEFSVGNFYEESFVDIFRRSWEVISHRCFQVKGKCASCENNDICVGCRAAAYYYLGDIEGPDPKCWLNPEARELYFAGE